MTGSNWDTTNSSGEWALTLGEDGKTWTGTLVVTTETQVKLYDKGGICGHDGGWIDPAAGTGENGNAVLAAGTYHFQYVVGDANFTYWADGEDAPATPDPVVPTEGTVVYLVPNSNWVQGDARFALYTWNDAGNLWIDMTDDDADGVYECELPAGYVNVIFCRMNPATSDNVWENKWDQTSNLTLSGNCFTVNDGDWNNANGTWSTK